MKYLFSFMFVITALLISSCASFKELPEEQRKVQKIFELPDMTQKQIYDKSSEWMAKRYVSSKEVIQLKDPENGKIIGRGITEFTNFVVNIPCEYLISIEAKDGKLRVTCDQFIGLWGEYQNDRRPVVEEGFVNEVKQNLDRLISDLHSSLKENKKDNW